MLSSSLNSNISAIFDSSINFVSPVRSSRKLALLEASSRKAKPDWSTPSSTFWLHAVQLGKRGVVGRNC
jgi:hypothetical protein